MIGELRGHLKGSPVALATMQSLGIFGAFIVALNREGSRRTQTDRVLGQAQQVTGVGWVEH
jgi:hypothetical protein